MRRVDFECKDLQESYEFLDKQEDGVLVTLTASGEPSIRPMNYVRINDVIYFHGAKLGEKLEGVSQKSSFNIYKTLSMIPSFWSDKKSACPATVLFQSLIVKGTLELVSDSKEKAVMFQSLMEKLQSEGGYLPFSENVSFYEKPLKLVNVFKLPIEEMSYKLKLGQNWKKSKKKEIHGLLIERGTLVDLKTAKLMSEKIM